MIDISSKVFLIVDETLENLSSFKSDRVISNFQDQSQLNSDIMSSAKNLQFRRKFNITDFISNIREQSENKMVISVTHPEIVKEFIFNNIMNNERMRILFDKLKSKVKINSLEINSLRYYIDIALRRVVIQNYYKDNISPEISNYAKSITAGSYRIDTSGWGFIAAYRPKLINDFKDKDIYWIKIFHSPEIDNMVKMNLVDPEAKIFYDDKDNNVKIKYIDIFTSDRDQFNLFRLITPENDKVFTVCINSLKSQLLQFNLLDSIEIKSYSYKTKRKL